MATRKPPPRPTTGTKTAGPKGSQRAPAVNAAKRTAAKSVPKAAIATNQPDAAKTKHKLVRDSFTIPKNEYAALGALKQRAMRLMRSAKKSELLRAGIRALSTMTDRSFLSALDAVPSLKTGRPTTTAESAVKPPSKKP